MDWPDGVTIRLSDDENADVPACMKHWQLVSDRIRVAVEQVELTGVTFHPVITIPAKPGPSPTYWYGHISFVHGAVDMDASIYTYFELKQLPEPKLVMIKPVLYRDAVAGHDVFRIPEDKVGVFCSPRFKEVFESRGLTGVEFDRVKLT